MIGWTEILQNIIYFVSLYYVVFWLIVLLEYEEPRSKRLQKHPPVTIIIPAYNEEENIIPTIDSVAALQYPPELIKVIVVDDGSKDRTYARAKEHLKSIRKKHPKITFQLLTQKNAGKHAAMNNALRYTHTPFFATLDADSFPYRDALKNIMAEFDDPKIAAVSPILKVYKPKNAIQTIQWLEYAVNHFYKSLISNVDAIHVLPGPLSVYRTAVVKKLGGFRDAHKTEDMEIAMRIQKADYKIRQCNNAFVTTKAPYTIKSLYRQRHRWNHGTFKNLIDYRKMMFSRKYGDFGLFQLPVILISGIMGISILGLILYDFFKSIKPTFKLIQLYNYNIISYLQHTEFNMIWLDLDLKSLVTFLGFFIITLIVLWLSLRLYREKYRTKITFSFILYIFFYYIFLAIVWIGVFKDVLLRKETGWKK